MTRGNSVQWKNPGKKNGRKAPVPFADFFVNGSHGFIGPIGDDFPSLIPLIFGLLMFFTAFTITFNSFDAANTSFADDTALLRISRTLQSNSYIFSRGNFEELCSQIGVVNIKFAAVISDDWVKPGSAAPSGGGMCNSGGAKSIFDLSIFRDFKGNHFYCSNQDAARADSLSDFVTFKDIADTRVVSRIFPIVVEDDRVVKPMHIVVVAWK